MTDKTAFWLGVEDGAKIAAHGNPASPAKSSLPSGKPESPRTPYLNTPAGRTAAQHAAGEVAKSVPAGGYVNTPGGASAGDQQPGFIGRGSAPDTGELGKTQGHETVTKNAAGSSWLSEVFGDES